MTRLLFSCVPIVCVIIVAIAGIITPTAAANTHNNVTEHEKEILLRAKSVLLPNNDYNNRCLGSWNHYNWHCIDFVGVTCDATTGRVISISLTKCQLDGSIPGFLSELKDLEVLSLEVNNLTSTLPPELGSLSKLILFDIFENQLEGPIPVEYSNLESLQHFLAYQNRLTSLPCEFGRLRNLVMLDVYSNSIRGELCESFSNMTKLQHLQLYNNLFTASALPKSWANLTSLKALVLSSNPLCSPPPVQQQNNATTNTTTPGVSTSCHIELPPEWGHSLRSLELLRLSSLGISGTLPPSWSQLGSLAVLDLSANALTGDALPAEWSDPTTSLIRHSLMTIDLSSNKFGRHGSSHHDLQNRHDPVPRGYATAFPRLYSVRLGSNNFGGELPVEFLFMPSARLLDFSNNGISSLPTVPSSSSSTLLRPSVSLEALYLNANNITSILQNVLPSWGATTASLRILALDNNFNISGTIPSELASFTKLNRFSAVNNQLTGSVPRSLLPRLVGGTLTSLTVEGNCIDDSLGTLRDFFKSNATTSSSSAMMRDLDISPGENCTHIHPFQTTLLTAPYSVKNMNCSWEEESAANVWFVDAASLLCSPIATVDAMGVAVHVVSFDSDAEGYEIAFHIANTATLGPGTLSLSFFTCAVVAQIRPMLRFDRLGPPFSAASSPQSLTQLQEFPSWHNKWQLVPTPLPTGLFSFSVDSVRARFGFEYSVEFDVVYQLAPFPNCPASTYPDYTTTLPDWKRISTKRPVSYWKTFAARPCLVESSVGVRGTTICAKCPSLAHCNGTSVIMTAEPAWRPSREVLPFVKCPRTRGCDASLMNVLGEGEGKGNNNSADAATNISSSTSESVPALRSGDECGVGYKGQFCSACDESNGYTKSSFFCVKCRGRAFIIVIAFVAIAAVLVLITAAVYLSIEPPSDEAAWYDKYVLCGRTLLNHLSVVGVLSNTGAAASLQASARELLHLQNSANSIGNLGSVNSLSCLGFSANIFSLFDAQWIALAVLIVVEMLIFGVYYRRASVVFTVLLCLLQVFFASVATSSAQILRCDSVNFFDEVAYLLGKTSSSTATTTAIPAAAGAASVGAVVTTVNYHGWDPQLVCNDDYRVRAAVSLVLFCVAAPILTVIVRNALVRRNQSSDNKVVEAAMAFLTMDYQQEHWYWEFIVMGRKLLVALAIFAPPDTIQIGLFQVVCALSLLLTQRFSPFKRRPSTDLELLTHISSIVAAQMLQVAEVGSAAHETLVVLSTVVVVVSQLVTIAAIVYVTVWNYHHHHYGDDADHHRQVVTKRRHSALVSEGNDNQGTLGYYRAEMDDARKLINHNSSRNDQQLDSAASSTEAPLIVANSLHTPPSASSSSPHAHVDDDEEDRQQSEQTRQAEIDELRHLIKQKDLQLGGQEEQVSSLKAEIDAARRDFALQRSELLKQFEQEKVEWKAALESARCKKTAEE